MSAGDDDADLAERYGYVNRAIPDAEFVSFVDHFAQRIARFDLRAMREIKAFVNAVSLPAAEEFPPQRPSAGCSGRHEGGGDCGPRGRGLPAFSDRACAYGQGALGSSAAVA